MEKYLNSYLHSNWGIDSIPQNDPFESALSSMVSSPTGVPSNGGDRIMIKELIGRLGSICDSGEASCIATGNNSTSNSCYTTPLNSPPKRFNLSPLAFPNYPPNLASLSPDPGFVKLSSFGDTNFVEGKMGKVYRLENGEIGDSREESSVSEMNPRKRKSISLVNVKDKIESKDEDSNGKRSKTEDENGRNEKTEDSKNTSKGKQRNNSKNDDKEASKLDPPKDYIHVRARRGQATDSHSLAERVRREKISERMNFLQDLVPGCNKVTGKATVLDEIINYVQSLQRQVEFLSMKLATVNPRMDFKDMFTRRGSSLTQTMYQLDENSAQGFPLGFHNLSQQMQIHSFTNGTENLFSVNSDLNLTGIRQNTSLQLASTDGYGDSMARLANFWDDDLQSIVQMGIAQNHAQSIHGNLPNAQMKTEL